MVFINSQAASYIGLFTVFWSWFFSPRCGTLRAVDLSYLMMDSNIQTTFMRFTWLNCFHWPTLPRSNSMIWESKGHPARMQKFSDTAATHRLRSTRSPSRLFGFPSGAVQKRRNPGADSHNPAKCTKAVPLRWPSQPPNDSMTDVRQEGTANKAGGLGALADFLWLCASSGQKHPRHWLIKAVPSGQEFNLLEIKSTFSDRYFAQNHFIDFPLPLNLNLKALLETSGEKNIVFISHLHSYFTMMIATDRTHADTERTSKLPNTLKGFRSGFPTSSTGYQLHTPCLLLHTEKKSFVGWT